MGSKLGIDFGCDLVKHHLEVIDSLNPESTASLQKDLKACHESEIQGQLFNFIDLARRLGIDTPVYDTVAGHFGNLINANKNFHISPHLIVGVKIKLYLCSNVRTLTSC